MSTDTDWAATMQRELAKAKSAAKADETWTQIEAPVRTFADRDIKPENLSDLAEHPCCRGIGGHEQWCESGAAILDRAAAHRVIEADELPAVLEAIDVARNGPEEQRPDNARALTEAQERIEEEEEERADVADRVREGVAHPYPFDLCESESEIADPDRGVWAGPAGARALLAALERADHVDPDSVTMLQVSLAFACDEVDTLRTRVEDLEQDARASEAARLRAEVERLTEALSEMTIGRDRWFAVAEDRGEQLANASVAVDVARRQIERFESDTAEIELRAAIDQHLPRGGPGDDVSRVAHAGVEIERLTASVMSLHGLHNATKAKLARASNSLKRWQARARKAEAMAETLTVERDGLVEERDGLTLRLGGKVARGIRPRKRGGKAK